MSEYDPYPHAAVLLAGPPVVAGKGGVDLGVWSRPLVLRCLAARPERPPGTAALRRTLLAALLKEFGPVRRAVQETAARVFAAATAAGEPVDVDSDLARPISAAALTALFGIPATTPELPNAVRGGETVGAPSPLAAHVQAALRAPAGPPTGLIAQLRAGVGPLSPDAAYRAALYLTPLFSNANVLGDGLTNMLGVLLTYPGALAALLAGGSLHAAVEELLRFAAHFHMIGVALPSGADTKRCLLALSLADRDPETFAQPDTLDLTRYPNPHIAFGHGAYRCLGAPLVRLVLRETLAVLLARTDVPRMARPVVWKYVTVDGEGTHLGDLARLAAGDTEPLAKWWLSDSTQSGAS